jgi:hypothetical protein
MSELDDLENLSIEQPRSIGTRKQIKHRKRRLAWLLIQRPRWKDELRLDKARKTKEKRS